MTDNQKEQHQQLNYPKSIQVKGTDSEGTIVYKNLNELWSKELVNDNNNDLKWYTSAADYWKSVDATVDGMLGGLSYVSDTDVECSNKFITEMTSLGRGRALDCGAGIGRVTQHLLLPLFEKVDLLEQNPLFLDEAKIIFKDEKRVVNYFAVGLQDFDFKDKNNGEPIKYDYNIAKKGFIMDKQDSSVTRTDEHLRYLFSQADATVTKSILQPNFPKSLFPVRLYAINSTPTTTSTSETSTTTTSETSNV
ncbi:hypothetical protein PPL_11426 [Heterostelium album PN500]|uniref:Alpha N-terminal protein methyltransferase 1 n=1 Tax=Heterostelium pallidum (strain ATCC 26659 / Pp 5 / PN500) TaxID=670386 RepID=D3BTD2_HETP5|nr:hypothetical protein PPL_11426 [Heterostelium album PN500]EFA75349.1 hypothetical protein PPL_11426 [Heterostelium album PN500]|eukprot:XP_020427483.1 hypothetical protein PPL_11426 [Heterostelium album PN500]